MYIHTDIQPYKHTYTYTHTYPAHIHECINTYPRTHIQTHRLMSANTYAGIYTQKHTHARARARTHTHTHGGFILLELFVTPAGISMGIKLQTEFFPIL